VDGGLIWFAATTTPGRNDLMPDAAVWQAPKIGDAVIYHMAGMSLHHQKEGRDDEPPPVSLAAVVIEVDGDWACVMTRHPRSGTWGAYYSATPAAGCWSWPSAA
jgi:hypothetical protein